MGVLSRVGVRFRNKASHHRIEELSTISQIGEAGAGGWEKRETACKRPVCSPESQQDGKKRENRKDKKECDETDPTVSYRPPAVRKVLFALSDE